jgi:BirA family transcriptional regulator, biotin operon repressor / biotin---[acetyl-CoA-carboxylase] ligase
MRRDEIQVALAAIPLVRRIYHFSDIPSTSDWAKHLILRAGPLAQLHGTLIVANHQTRGRGRLQRAWQAPPDKAVLFTLILEQPPQDRLMAMLGPIAVCEALRDMAGVHARVKYPNDVLVGERKVCGILLESVSASRRDFYTLGIGINVNQAPEDLAVVTANHLRPTSLAAETGTTRPLAAVLAAVLRKIGCYLEPDALSTLPARMNALCDTIGRLVDVHTHQGIVHGTAVAINPDGALVVRTESGIQQLVYSGDVMQLNVEC